MKINKKINKSKVKKGFTLIELLVSVLIVGILVAICLPQYLLSVDKSTFAKLQTMTHSIANAHERYYWQHDTYASKFSQLDIELAQNETKIDGCYCIELTDTFCCMRKGSDTGSASSYVVCGKKDNSYFYAEVLYRPQENVRSFTKWCITTPDSKRGVKLCELYGKRKSNVYLPTLKGTITNTYYYEY